MKYRLLTLEELDGLKPEFINFLIMHGYDAASWQQIKQTTPSVAVELMSLFSDFIFENIVNKVQYLEYQEKSGIKLFKCDDSEIHLIGIESKSDSADFDRLLEDIQFNADSYYIYKTSKPYMPAKNAEIFRMINSGALVSSGAWFEYFQLYLHSK